VSGERAWRLSRAALMIGFLVGGVVENHPKQTALSITMPMRTPTRREDERGSGTGSILEQEGGYFMTRA